MVRWYKIQELIIWVLDVYRIEEYFSILLFFVNNQILFASTKSIVYHNYILSSMLFDYVLNMHIFIKCVQQTKMTFFKDGFYLGPDRYYPK